MSEVEEDVPEDLGRAGTKPRRPHRDKRSDLVSALVALVHFSFTYLPVYLAVITKPGPLLVVYWLWFGLAKNGLINLMHETSHQLTFRRKWANELLGGWVLAPLVLTNFASYRERHWEHHRYLGEPRDPKVVYRTNIGGGRFFALVVRCLTGFEALKRLTERPADTSGNVGTKHATLSMQLVTTQVLFIASIGALAYFTHATNMERGISLAIAYCGVYGYGLSSITVLAAALRGIGEHQIGKDKATKTDGEAAVRNLRCNVFTRALFGAYGFEEHATHHLEPGVPYYQLKERTAELAKDDATLVAREGYLTILARLVTQT